MGRFVQGEDRRQDYLLPASLDDYVSADNPVLAVEAFIDALDLKALEFAQNFKLVAWTDVLDALSQTRGSSPKK